MLCELYFFKNELYSVALFKFCTVRAGEMWSREFSIGLVHVFVITISRETD